MAFDTITHTILENARFLVRFAAFHSPPEFDPKVQMNFEEKYNINQHYAI